jgi:hypothetical protein
LKWNSTDGPETLPQASADGFLTLLKNRCERRKC